MQLSFEEFKSIIGRNSTEATSYTFEFCDVACIMKPDQFGRGFLVEAKNHAECQRKSSVISAEDIVSVALTELNLSSYKTVEA